MRETTHVLSPNIGLGLPDYRAMSEPVFSWGQQSSESFTYSLHATYSEVVHWRPNLFRVTQGHVGSAFVSELARLFNAFATASALESVALNAATVLPILLLQKPSRNSKLKQHISCLERCMKIWQAGDLNELVLERRTIQKRLPKTSPDSEKDRRRASNFSKLMCHGKVKEALDLLSNKNKGRPLHLDDTILTSDEGRQKSVRVSS